MNVNYPEIGKRIAQRRKSLGYTQAKVSEIANIGVKYLSDIETSHSIPSIETLLKICDAIKTTPNYLLCGLEDETDIPDSNILMGKYLLLAHHELKKQLLFSYMDMLNTFDKL